MLISSVELYWQYSPCVVIIRIINSHEEFTLDMYSIHQARKAISNPILLLEEVERCYYSIFDSQDYEGIEMRSKEWDNLILLDACRYDFFKELHEFSGKLEKKHSKAPKTDEFLRSNFAGADMTDTVYVTGNPQYYRIENEIYNADPINCSFYDVINVWKDKWDQTHDTVKPQAVTEAAIDAVNKYSNKRLLVHYMQPHAPYIGPTGTKCLPTDSLDFWKKYKLGKISCPANLISKAYRENLDMVLQWVEKLVSQIQGLTVITSDHGELLGERCGPIPYRKYGHPRGIRAKKLIEIPWMTLTNDNGRRDISGGQLRSENEKVRDDIIIDRLRNLGYTN